jgi:hypothetical protein
VSFHPVFPRDFLHLLATGQRGNLRSQDTGPHSELGTSSEQLLFFCQKEVEIEINVSILRWKKVQFYTMSLLKNRIP